MDKQSFPQLRRRNTTYRNWISISKKYKRNNRNIQEKEVSTVRALTWKEQEEYEFYVKQYRILDGQINDRKKKLDELIAKRDETIQHLKKEYNLSPEELMKIFYPNYKGIE